ncbi:Hypothetical protein LUCI_2025 [Lucifera butyrica]|uniref:Uncharacterized protein n=1 Tax=Lucifera butyrica TaxID=1351585 RepID=A0A498R6H0_9FIRM|nr:hypothetical protein [Lucifera butyrica]VBB06789.1 Hypothetical protein LUCI_2025 [Lucifera butyrica]
MEPEKIIDDLFELIRQNTSQVAGLDKKLTVLCATLSEREKRCNEHNGIVANHEQRLKNVELWQAAQQGVTGFIQRWGPVIITCGVAVYVEKFVR